MSGRLFFPLLSEASFNGEDRLEIMNPEGMARWHTDPCLHKPEYPAPSEEKNLRIWASVNLTIRGKRLRPVAVQA